MALNTTMPTTTPAAIPATLGPPLDLASSVVVITVICACVCPGAVTTIVLARVTTEGAELFDWSGDGVGDGVVVWLSPASELALSELEVSELELSGFESESDFALTSDPDALPTLLLRPVSCMDQLLDPPPYGCISLPDNDRARQYTTYRYPCHIQHTWNCK